MYTYKNIVVPQTVRESALISTNAPGIRKFKHSVYQKKYSWRNLVPDGKISVCAFLNLHLYNFLSCCLTLMLKLMGIMGSCLHISWQLILYHWRWKFKLGLNSCFVFCPRDGDSKWEMVRMMFRFCRCPVWAPHHMFFIILLSTCQNQYTIMLGKKSVLIRLVEH